MRIRQILALSLISLAFSSANAELILDYDWDNVYLAPGVSGTQSCSGDCTLGVNSEGYGLGNFIARGGNGTYTLNLFGIGAHNALSVSFDLAIIDSWDGDTRVGGTAPGPDVFMVADGSTLFSESFDNFDLNDDSFTGAPILGPEQLGFNLTWPDSLYNIELTFAHTTDFLTLTWSADALQSLADESWAIDNLIIRSVPEPGTLALLGIGLAALGFSRRRKAA